MKKNGNSRAMDHKSVDLVLITDLLSSEISFTWTCMSETNSTSRLKFIDLLLSLSLCMLFQSQRIYAYKSGGIGWIVSIELVH